MTKIKGGYLYTDGARYDLWYAALVIGLGLLLVTLPPRHGEWVRLGVMVFGAVLFFSAAFQYFRVISGKGSQDPLVRCPHCEGTGRVWRDDPPKD